MSLLVCAAWVTTDRVRPDLGKKLAAIREEGFTQMEIAVAAGVSHSIVQKLEAGRPVSRKTFRKIAAKLRLNVDEYAALIIQDNPKQSPPFASAIKFLEEQGIPVPDDNIDRPPRHAARIPEWESEVAAGQWVDCISAQLHMHTDRDVIERGMFIIRVRGDSMMPEYEPGCRVLFRIVRLGDEPLIVGEDYCFQNSDGQCTLKRLKSIDDNELVLAPLNRKYKPLRLARDMLARASIVEGILKRPAHAGKSKG